VPKKLKRAQLLGFVLPFPSRRPPPTRALLQNPIPHACHFYRHHSRVDGWVELVVVSDVRDRRNELLTLLCIVVRQIVALVLGTPFVCPHTRE
jgi:hypothetical protein